MRWLLVALLFVPVGAAQIIAVEADVAIPVPFGNGEEQSIPGQTCTRTPYISQTNTSITFFEEPLGTGCAIFVVPMVAPPGAGHFRLTFEANRIIDAGPSTVAVNMIQEAHVVLDDQTPTFPMFPPDGPSAPFTRITTPFLDEQATYSLGFLFHDDGGPGGQFNPGAAHGLNSTVRNAFVEYPAVPIPVTDGSIALPPELVGNIVEMRIFVAPGTDVRDIRGAAGSMDAAANGNLLVLDATDLAQQGNGITVELSAAPRPTNIAPLHWVPAFVVPAIGIAAVARSLTYYNGTQGIYRRTARYVLLVAVVGLGYAATISIAAPILQGDDLATLPLTGLAAATYVQWLVLALAFVSIIMLASRSQLHAVQDDLHRRERQREELLRSNRELEHFASVASHDLQEPLRKIAGFTALLAENPDSPEAKEYARFAHDGASRMQRMVQDLLRYSRMGQQEIERLPVDMNELADEVIADLATMLDEAGAKVEVRQLPEVHGAASLLRQLLSNLLQNAVKYRHPRRAPRVRISGHQWPFETQIVVTDNGRGIPEGQEEKVFQLFRRVHEDQPGTGIGLALCARIVALHGGRIWVESSDKGSKFHFTIPREP